MTSATSCSLGLSSPLEIHLFQALLRQENNRQCHTKSAPDTHMVGISQRAVCHVETRGLSGDGGGAHQYKNTSEKCEGWGLLQ